MPVKIANAYSPTTEVGAALNNAITSYANNIPTYGEQQEGLVNANKAAAPSDIGARVRALYSNSGSDGQPLTPQMVQDQIGGLAEATAKGGDVGKLGELLRVVVANSANPESTQMIDRAQQGAGQAYNTTQTGFDTAQKNDLLKVDKQQAGANYRTKLQTDAQARIAAAKTNPQAIKLQEKTKGKQDFENVLTDLQGLYKGLDENGGAVSTDKGTLHNIAASFANGETGQYIGRKLGTENQSTRNQIAAKLPLLSAAIKSATGMSSQQLNSNFELQQYMKALTSPGADIQANMKTIAALSKQFGTGSLAGGGVPTTPGAAATVENSGAVVEPGAAGDGAIYDDVTGKNYRLGDDGQYYEE